MDVAMKSDYAISPALPPLSAATGFRSFTGPFAKLAILRFAPLLGLALVLRLVAMSVVPLIPEEAYYWMYAQHPQLSYFDHPPMVAWAIWLGTAILGDTELGVRFVGQILMLGATGLMYLLGRMWFD